MINLSAALVVATHPQQCRALVHLLEQLGLKPALAFTVEDARHVISEFKLAIVCCVPELRDGTYRDVLTETRRQGLPLVLVTRTVPASDSQSTEPGVSGQLTFPFSSADGEKVILQVLRKHTGSRLAATA